MKDELTLFGLRAVIEAIQAGRDIDHIWVKSDLHSELAHELRQVLQGKHIPVSRVPAERINRMAHGKNHQGVVAQVAAVSYQHVEDIIPTIYEAGRDPLLMMLDGITDVRNFGAIARTCHCAGADAIVIPAKGSVSVNADAVKTSAGALHSLPVCRENSLKQTIRLLKQSGLRVVAASEKAKQTYTDTDLTGPLCLLMGAEDRGVDPANLALCDNWVRIPMFGDIESLNVSVAAGILVYEVIRQRNNR